MSGKQAREKKGRAFELVEWPVLMPTNGGKRFVPFSAVKIGDSAPSSFFFDSLEGADRSDMIEKMEEVEDKVVIGQSQYRLELADEFKRGVESGRATGQKEAETALKHEYEERFQNLERCVVSAIIDFRETVQRAETEAVRLALDVARRIVETTVEVKPEYIVEVVRRGLLYLGAAKPIRIRMSEQDYEFMQVVGFPTELSGEELGVEYVPDESLKSGCVFETNFGEVDMRLDQLWEQIKDQIFGGAT